MKTCDYCGEYSKVRKAIFLGCIGNNFYYDPLLGTMSYNYICEKCSKAKQIKYEKEMKKDLERQENKRKEWIKTRDKILKENK